MLQKWKRYCDGSALLAWITLLEAAFWLAVMLVSLLAKYLHFDPGISEWLTLPAYFPTFLTRPWTLATYMWIHFDIFHVLFNLLWLYWFGRILLTSLSDRNLAYYFFGGGIAGGIFFMAASAMGLSGGWLCGCSAAVLSVMAGASIRHPNLEIRLFLIGSVRLKWVALLCCLLVFLGGGGNQAAHIGGLAWGVALTLLDGGISITLPQRGKGKRRERKRRPDKVVKALNERRNDMERLDMLLDKIKASGYESLSAKERKELNEISQRIKK